MQTYTYLQWKLLHFLWCYVRQKRNFYHFHLRGNPTHIEGFHIGDARIKKLMPTSKCSIGRHVEFWRARQKFWRRPTARHQRENPYSLGISSGSCDQSSRNISHAGPKIQGRFPGSGDGARHQWLVQHKIRGGVQIIFQKAGLVPRGGQSTSKATMYSMYCALCRRGRTGAQ